MRSYAIVLSVLSMLAACSDPKCPADLIQVGNVCRRCPKDSVKAGETCLSLDAGMSIDPVEIDEGAGNDEARDAERDTSPNEIEGAVEDGKNTATSEAGFVASDGSGDAGSAQRCFVDKDKDGVGAGAAVSCSDINLVTSLGFALSAVNSDCDDNDPQRSPNLTDICGDRVDNDCDGKADDDSNNACGGPCTIQLAHTPGEACDNGLAGACRRTGVYVCQGTGITCGRADSHSWQ